MNAEDSPAAIPWPRFWAAVVSCVVLLFIAAVLFPVFAQPRMGGGPNRRLEGVKQLTVALLIYADENGDRLPPDLSNPGPLLHVSYQYRPSGPDDGQVLANGLLSGKGLDEIPAPAETVLAYYSRPWNGHGLAGYVDGHARVVKSFDDLLQQLTVDPVVRKKGSHGQ